MHIYRTLLVVSLLSICVPLGTVSADSPEASSPEFFTAKFVMASRFSNSLDQEQFFFFPDKDAVVFSEPLLSDSTTARRQKALFLTTPGKWDCKERNNPPASPQWTYVERCLKLISRTTNSFIIDSLLKIRGAIGGLGEFQRRSRLSVQISGNTCTAQLISPERSYANNPNVLTPLTVVGQSCLRIRVRNM